MLVSFWGVHIFIFLCTWIVGFFFFWYSPCGLSYNLSAVKGAFLMVRSIQNLCKFKVSFSISFCGARSREQQSSDAKASPGFSIRTSDKVNEKGRNWVISWENSFHNRKCLVMNCLGCHVVFVETRRFYCEWRFYCRLSVILQVLYQNAELPFLRHSTLVLTSFILFFSLSFYDFNRTWILKTPCKIT